MRGMDLNGKRQAPASPIVLDKNLKAAAETLSISLDQVRHQPPIRVLVGRGRIASRVYGTIIATRHNTMRGSVYDPKQRHSCHDRSRGTHVDEDSAIL